MFAFSVDLFFAAYAAGEHYLKHPEYIAANVSLPYLYGPCIFLYIIFLGRNKTGFKPKYLLHFLPFIIVNIIGIDLYFFTSPEYKLSVMLGKTPLPLYAAIISNVVPVHGCIYTVVSIREAFKF